MTTTHRIALIPGDGIGTEVIPPATAVLDAVGRRHGVAFTYDGFDWSCERYANQGAMMPEDGLDRIRNHDAILLGAVGWAGVPDHVSLWGLLIPIRREFRQYVNLRPITVFDGVRSPLRHAAAPGGRQPTESAGREEHGGRQPTESAGPEEHGGREPTESAGREEHGGRQPTESAGREEHGDTEGGVDFVVVRENTEGEYSEIGGRFGRGTDGEFAVQEAVFTRTGVSRIADYAFDLATRRRNHVTSATKSNGIVHTMPFWDSVVTERAAAFPGVSWRSEHIDALAAKVVLDPSSFDVIVASNLFGDILSDLAAAVAGSIGIAPSGNLNPSREYPSMFEPVHGSAPDIAGTGVANPLGAIWSAALMLEHLGHADAGAEVLSAIRETLRTGATLTRDLGGTASTDELTRAVLERLG